MANELSTIIEGQRSQFSNVCCDPSIEFDREASFALQIIGGSTYLTSLALQNKFSLSCAIVNVSAMGISLNPASKLAYLVPRKGAICLDISYMGMMHIAQQSGAIQWGQAVIVCAADKFELMGIDQPPKHSYDPFSAERGDIVGVYVIVKTDTGDYLTHTMPISKVEDIRDRSEAWKAYLAKGTKCPWVTDYEEMVKKTCVKQAYKYWPRRERLDNAIHHMNVEGDEGINFEKDITPTGEIQKPNHPSVPKMVLETLTEEEQKRLKGIALSVQSEFYLNGVEAAVKMWESNDLDIEMRTACWSYLESNEKSAIKAKQAELRKMAEKYVAIPGEENLDA